VPIAVEVPAELLGEVIEQLQQVAETIGPTAPRRILQ
jgi:hypothetical protein